MTPQIIFPLQLVLGYVAWLLFYVAYVQPRARSLSSMQAHRAIATLHSFRFFGLVFLVPGFVGPSLPAGFAAFAAYWDLAAGVLAMMALLAYKIRPLFLALVASFNIVGTIDLVLDYYHANRLGLPAIAGQLGAAYIIPVIVVPALMITHIAAFALLLRPRPEPSRHLVHEGFAA